MKEDKTIFELFEEIKKALDDKEIIKRISDHTKVQEEIVRDKIYLSMVTVYKQKMIELLNDINNDTENVVNYMIDWFRK